jgi:hypothetical protein
MRNRLAFQLALTAVLVLPATAFAANTTTAQPVTRGQIVRLSLVEGDVRIARDEQQGQAKNADWEKAISGLPLESGFSLATGDGRAVIELQDASTLYMGPNSVLVMNDLTTTLNSPNTEIALLSGTVTLHVHSIFAGEHFILRTPTDTMAVPYPDRNDVRVTAYMDALALTPLRTGTVMPSNTGVQTPAAGQTLYYRAGKPVAVADKGDQAAMADWDKWVDGQYAQRVAAYATVMKETGLKTLVPGLESLQGQGKFVDCGEYGKCWEPPAPAAAEAQANQTAGASALTASTDSNAGGGSSTQPVIIHKTSLASVQNTGGMGGGLGFDSYFPCGPDSYYYRMMMYQNGGMMPMGYGMGGYGMGAYGGMAAYGGMGAYGSVYDPWNWAVCHSGSWIFQDNRYLWVPGSQIQYQPPVQWVKFGNKQGFVPIHPRDVAGQTPVNLQNFIIARGKNSQIAGAIRIDNGSPVKILNSPPRGFREGYSISLAKSDSPHMMGRMVGVDGGQKSPIQGNARSVPISFDHESRSFMVARPVGGSNTRTVNEPVGSFLARSGTGGFGGPVGYHPGVEAGGRGNMGALNGGSGGQFHGGAVFNGGGQRGGGEMGGNGNFGGGARSASASPSSGGGNMGGGAAPSGGGGSFGGGGHSGGGGGSMGGGGGNMGGGGGGGGHASPSH